MNISKATKKNWERLNVNNTDEKLQKRANKFNSKKIVVPKEYQGDKRNAKRIISFVEEVKDKYEIKDLIYSFALSFLLHYDLIELSDNKIYTNNEFLLQILNDFNGIQQNEIIRFDLREYDFDILGFIYQILLIEGEKSKNGVYYTPEKITSLMLQDIKLQKNEKLLDPACGTGSFLLNVQTSYPENLYGFDIDSNAVFISKINLISKHRNKRFSPNIRTLNFLELEDDELNKLPTFDYIITNPPWGNKVDIKNEELKKKILSREFFSYFLIQSSKIFNGKGQCIFLLPESFLKVNAHSQIRLFLLENFSIDEIHELGKQFTSVLSNVIIIKFSRSNNNEVRIYNNHSNFKISKNVALNNEGYRLNLFNESDKKVIDKLDSKKMFDLSESKWGLGIVTGNNKLHIKNHKMTGMEKIYTGKEISKFKLKESNKYILYKRDLFQQVAKDSIYRADEKLVYKFISKKLQFAFDDQQRLFLNSANILIPKIPFMNVKTVLGFLNSDVFQFYYLKKFGQIKILKSQLKKLPFPVITEKENKEITELVNEIIHDEKDDRKLNEYINNIFDLSTEEAELIRRCVK
ncbi:MAG: N-6 DNA methylase [bacterium]